MYKMKIKMIKHYFGNRCNNRTNSKGICIKIRKMNKIMIDRIFLKNYFTNKKSFLSKIKNLISQN